MKYKLLIFTYLFFIFASLAIAQTNERATPQRSLKTHAKIDLGLSGLGLSFETPISTKILLEAAAGVGAGYKIDEDFRYRMYFDDPAIFVSIHGKYYYDQKDRTDRSRPIRYNAGNFFGIKAKYTTPTLIDEKTWHTLLTGFHWGMQRKVAKHFVYQFNVGIGAAIDLEKKTSTNVTLFPDVNFRISYVIPL